jgi:DNA methylase
MSWRIEQANPFAVLCELPDGLFQTCLLRLPTDLPGPCVHLSLGEVFRVTREDGTLWLVGVEHHAAAEEAGWCRPRSSPAHRRLHPHGGSRCPSVTLFAKHPKFHFNPRPLPLGYARSRHSRLHPRSHDHRRAWCVPSGTGSAIPPSLIEWCIRASTSPRACEICGAAWRRNPGASSVERLWRPGCPHGNGRGKSLVLDPFCGTGEIGVLAVLAGRSFLGIECKPRSASVAARRLAGVRWGTVR